MPKNSPAAKRKPGNTRVTGKEQYYTPVSLAERLLGEVSAVVPDLLTRTILEPGGGTGSFVTAARNIGIESILSFDIEPKHADVAKANFLTKPIKLKNAITISNPPFGRNNSLSIPFFNKAANHSDVIAFIVPRSWRKWSVINRLDRSFHLVADHDIQIDYVDDAGDELSKRTSLATCFQIWQRKDSLRPHYSVEDKKVITKVAPELADVALTVFGFGCGSLKTEFERKPNTTSMFLKLNHPQALAALQSVDFSRFYKNTAYTEALSIQEINYLLNETIFGDSFLIEKVN